MEKKFVWLLLSCLTVLSLMLASCAPAPATPTAPTAPTTPVAPTTPTLPTAPTTPTAPTAPTTEVPKYGGVFTFYPGTFDGNFDDTVSSPAGSHALNMTNDSLVQGDWTKGLAGSGESTWMIRVPMVNLYTGHLAESWELVGNDTIIYHLRKGIHWQNKAPLNGREFTSADVVYTIQSNYDIKPWSNPKSYTYARSTPEERPLSVRAIDKYTVELKGTPGFIGELWKRTAVSKRVLAPELYGAAQNDWRRSVGTGPFMITDYVDGSSATFVRNPNYWMTDPIGPGKGNQLPYLDGVKMLFIADKSTQMAALRTAKLDHLRDITREDTESLLKSTPTLKVAKYLEAVNALWPRVDNPKLPWYDKKVRYALNMAIDRQTISKDFYGGDAEIVAYPAVPDAAYKNVGIYIPLGEMSPTARQLYEYNPEKAKQLLAEAGYPKGFKIEVITVAKTVDEISILKDYLAKIGVDVQIALKEQSVFTSVTRSRGQSEAVYGSVSSAVPYGWQAFRPTDPTNLGAIDDPVVNKAIADFAGYFSIDDKKAFGEIMAGVFPYILEQAWIVQFPAPYRYTLWHPWVKNYHGEWLVGTGILWNFVNWTWIDQGLKKSLGF